MARPRSRPAASVRSVAPHALAALREAAIPLSDPIARSGALLERIGDARFVLLGEATHGTHEFYAERAALTLRLVEEKGFRAVAIEGDWPDASRVNRFVRGLGDDADAETALSDFKRFPGWMWRNVAVVDLATRLRERNLRVEPRKRAGFYGLDLYSLYASIEAVLHYLDDVDPHAARRARERYACFGRYRDDGQAYGKATLFGATPSCEQAALRQVREMHEKARDFAARDGRLEPDDHFHAAQNARVVADAERYYRAMFHGRVQSWNLRDRHMLETLASLVDHLETTGPAPAKVVVWAHNSHLGDARATELSDGGEFNLGQLCRERFGRDAFLLGFTTHRGSVTAAHDWDGPAELRRLLPATEGCYESLFHATGLERFLLFPRRGKGLVVPPEPLLERAVGVVYRSDTERASHYFEAHLSRQFDAVVHLDETRAVEPLDHREEWAAAEELSPGRA